MTFQFAYLTTRLLLNGQIRKRRGCLESSQEILLYSSQVSLQIKIPTIHCVLFSNFIQWVYFPILIIVKDIMWVQCHISTHLISSVFMIIKLIKFLHYPLFAAMPYTVDAFTTWLSSIWFRLMQSSLMCKKSFPPSPGRHFTKPACGPAATQPKYTETSRPVECHPLMRKQKYQCLQVLVASRDYNLSCAYRKYQKFKLT